jgi:hypothetical protein
MATQKYVHCIRTLGHETIQVDRLKTEGFQGQTIRDYTRRRAVELAIEPTVVETEKVLNGLIRAL